MSPKLYMQVFILLVSIICISCATPDIDEGEVNRLRPNINQNINTNTDPNANVAEDNENELSSLINLPFSPVENVYREDTADAAEEADPETKQLTVVLQFSDEDTEALVNSLEEKGKPFETKVDPEPWFPAELTAKSQMSGDESIKGTGYLAESFYKEPYQKGTLTRVDKTNYFVLILRDK